MAGEKAELAEKIHKTQSQIWNTTYKIPIKSISYEYQLFLGQLQSCNMADAGNGNKQEGWIGRKQNSSANLWMSTLPTSVNT